MADFFKVIYQSKKTKSRLGQIKTSHGVINTPSFVAVGTKGTVKSILPGLLKEIKTQAVFVNTYHLVTHPGVETIEKAGGIHSWAGLNLPLMSDSGGFQIFSLAKNSSYRGNSKYQKKFQEQRPAIVKISDDGVRFRSVFDGTVLEFTPEKSIEYQKKIGADIVMAFDECIYYQASYTYTKEATDRTHRWLLRSIKKFKSLQVNNLRVLKTKKPKVKDSSLKIPTRNLESKKQYLYGIIQGGIFEDLRKKSAEFVVSQDIDGVAIGGVSVGETKKEMREQVKWVSAYLPEKKPVHLLGVGQLDDVFDLVQWGIDTFDCVEPTRLARMGIIYQIKDLSFKTVGSGKFITQIDILRGVFRDDLTFLDEECDCFVCRNFTKSYLHHLFKNKELLGYTLATYHNLWVVEKFFEKVRNLIGNDLL